VAKQHGRAKGKIEEPGSDTRRRVKRATRGKGYLSKNTGGGKNGKREKITRKEKAQRKSRADRVWDNKIVNQKSKEPNANNASGKTTKG